MQLDLLTHMASPAGYAFVCAERRSTGESVPPGKLRGKATVCLMRSFSQGPARSYRGEVLPKKRFFTLTEREKAFDPYYSSKTIKKNCQ